MSATPPLPPLPAPAPPLTFSPQQLEELRQAKVLGIKVKRATLVALGDAWSVAVFAGISLPLSLIGLDLSSILVSVGMVVVAVEEFRGAAALRRVDADAPRRLGRNQVVFATILILYALWNIAVAYVGSPLSKEILTQIAPLIEPAKAQHWARMIMLAVYGLLIVIAVFGQGGLALYYFSRTKYVRAYRASVPGWIIQLQETGVRV